MVIVFAPWLNKYNRKIYVVVTIDIDLKRNKKKKNKVKIRKEYFN